MLPVVQDTALTIQVRGSILESSGFYAYSSQIGGNRYVLEVMPLRTARTPIHASLIHYNLG